VSELKETILIVDDERGIVDMMNAYFSSQYEVLTAYSGEEAIKKAEQQPDLILLDINMPGIDGLTVCQTIRQHITCPILFLTARIETADKITGFQAGADDYIPESVKLKLGQIAEARLAKGFDTHKTFRIISPGG